MFGQENLNFTLKAIMLHYVNIGPTTPPFKLKKTMVYIR